MEKENILFCIPSAFLNIKRLVYNNELSLRSFHFHKEIELVTATKGITKCFFEKEEVLLKEGESLLINSNVIHKVSLVNKGDECTYIQIDTEQYASSTISNKEKYFFEFLNRNKKFNYKKDEKDGPLSQISEYIRKESEEKNRGYEIYLRAKGMEIIAYMTRYDLFGIKYYADNNIKKILPAITYINENYKAILTLKDISKSTGFSKYYLCKLFKDITGDTISEYINFIRLKEFERIYLETNKNILEISTDCGFNSIQYFNRVFKNHKGCTPREYKKLHINHFFVIKSE